MPRVWTPEAQRQRQAWFKKEVRDKRLSLLTELGPMCRWCGETDLELLQFDHVGGWKPQPVKKPNQLTRIRELWRDYVAWREFGVGGPIQVLCEKCNGWDGRHRQQENEVRRRRLGAVRKARRWRRATG